MINREILLKVLLLSNLVTFSLFGDNYRTIYNNFILQKARFQNSIGDYSFNEYVDGYNFTKKNFVVHGKNSIRIKTIRDKDTINYIRRGNKSFILTDGKTIPIKNRVMHWTDIQLPENGRIVGETRIFNVQCYHVVSDNMELWIDKTDNIPVMIVYNGKVKVKVIISSYVEINRGLFFPIECTIFVNDVFFSRDSIWNFKYTGG